MGDESFDGGQALPGVVERARSLDEIVTWLKAQRAVRSVRLAPYLLKSHPPQRDVIVEFSKPDGTSATKIVNVFELDMQHYRFHCLRDPE